MSALPSTAVDALLERWTMISAAGSNASTNAVFSSQTPARRSTRSSRVESTTSGVSLAGSNMSANVGFRGFQSAGTPDIRNASEAVCGNWPGIFFCAMGASSEMVRRMKLTASGTNLRESFWY